MVIYGDLLVLVNMYTDYFLLLAVKRCLHLKSSGLRLFLAALAGGFTGLLALVPLPKFAEWALLFLSAVFICFVAFRDRRWRMLIRSSTMFFVFSLILSGAVFLLAELLRLPAAVISGRVYFELSPLLLLVFTVAVYLLSCVFENLRGSKDDSGSLSFTVIETPLGRAEVLMKTDTGNFLREPFSGLPAAVVEIDAIESIIPQAVRDYLKGSSPTEGMRLIPCSTLSGRSLLPAFLPKSFHIKDTEIELNCYIAVSKNRLGASSWRGLLSPEILDQGGHNEHISSLN